MRIYGYHPVREALRTRPQEVSAVKIGRGRRGPRREEIERLCARHRVAFEEVSERELAELVDGVHNGFVAEVRERRAGAGADPAAAAGPRADPDLAVLVEDVSDPRNLGALLRVCEGAGVGQVLIRDRGTAPITPAVVKTSAGASEWLAIERVPNSANALERWKKEGFWVYGADAAGEPPWEIDLTGRVALCFGGEEKGLRRRTRGLCDRLIGLPMRGSVASLNIATAAAALLYETLRQRSK